MSEVNLILGNFTKRWTNHNPLSQLVFVWVALNTLWLALSYGRAGSSPIYDDVTYALTGQSFAIIAREEGPFNAFLEWIRSSPHSPFSEAISLLVHLIDLDFSEGLYLVNFGLAVGILFSLARLFSDQSPTQWLFAALLLASPIGYLAVDEFRPDIFFIFVGVLALLSQPFSKWQSFGKSSPFDFALVAAVLLFFIKPTWAVLAIGVMGGVILQRLTRFFYFPRRSSLGLYWAKRIAAVAAALILWFFWVGEQSFFRYVFATVKADYYTAGNPAQAIVQSLTGIFSRLGIPGLVLFLSVAAVLQILVFRSFADRSKGYQVRTIQLQALFVASGLGILATAISEHPSRFQGMFILYFFAAGVFGLFVLLLREGGFLSVVDGIFARTLMLLAIVGFTLVPTLPSFGEDFRSPGSLTQRVAAVIATDINQICMDKGIQPSVGVAFAETVSPEGVLYHLRGTEGITGATLLPLDFSIDDPERQFEEFADAHYVVTRSQSYFANRLPVNGLQHEISRIYLRSAPLVGEVAAWDEGKYQVFRQIQICR